MTASGGVWEMTQRKCRTVALSVYPASQQTTKGIFFGSLLGYKVWPIFTSLFKPGRNSRVFPTMPGFRLDRKRENGPDYFGLSGVHPRRAFLPSAGLYLASIKL